MIRDYEENGFIHSINAQDNMLEVIAMFEAGYSDLNIRKYDCRQ